MLIIVLAILLLLYFLSLFPGIRMRDKTTRFFMILVRLLLAVMILLFALSQAGIYLKSYWLPRILFWTWLYGTIALVAFGNRKLMTVPERFFYRLIFWAPLVLTILLLIPFIGVGIWLLLYPRLIADPSMVAYTDSSIRIEESHLIFMSPAPPLDVYQKKGLFAYKIETIPTQYDSRFDKLEVSHRDKSSYTVMHVTEDTVFRFEIRLR